MTTSSVQNSDAGDSRLVGDSLLGLASELGIEGPAGATRRFCM